MSSLVPCRATSNVFQVCATRWVCVSCTLYSSATELESTQCETEVLVRGVIQSSCVWRQVPLSLPLQCKVHLSTASVYQCSWHSSWTCHTYRHHFKPWHLNWSLYKDVCPKRCLTIYKNTRCLNLEDIIQIPCNMRDFSLSQQWFWEFAFFFSNMLRLSKGGMFGHPCFAV